MCVWSSSEPNTLVRAEGYDDAAGKLLLLFQNPSPFHPWLLFYWPMAAGIAVRCLCAGVSPAMLTEEMKAASRAKASAVDVGE